MKKIFLILLLPLLIAGCKVPNYAIGMSETEFLTSRRSLNETMEKTAQTAVYRQQWDDVNGHHNVQYYYFENGKLVRIDKGENMRRPDIIIQHQ